LWYCLSCTSHKLLLSWTKLINVSQSIMIYVIIGRKKQTELNSTDLRPTSVVISADKSVVLRPSTCLPAGLKRSGEFGRRRSSAEVGAALTAALETRHKTVK
jgi:hypothetical protein